MRSTLVPTLARGVAAFGFTSIALIGCATTPATSEGPKVPKATTGGACSPKVGSKAPDLVVDGKPAIVKGKVTIVDLWATWCPPCKDAFPKLQELYTKYQVQGLEVIGVSVDDQSDGIAPWVKERGTKFPVGWGSEAVASCWKPPNMPTSYLIDKNGVVRQIHNMWKPGDEKALEKEIKSLL